MSLSNSIFEAVMRDYDAIRFNNARLLKERTLEVFKKVPEIRQIEDTLVSISADFAKKSLFLMPAEFEILKDELAKKKSDLIEEKKRLLVQSGFDGNYLDLQYSCPLCRDTGFLNGKKCSCFASISKKYIYSDKTYMTALPSAAFDIFDKKLYSDNDFDSDTELSSQKSAVKLFTHFKNIAEDFENNKKNCLIYGGAGVGKTFLSSCLANKLIEAGYFVVFMSAFRFFELFEKHTFRRNEITSSLSAVEPVFDCDLLVIDDLGTEVVNSFTTSKLFDCINERILKNKITVISTNLDLPLIQSTYSERIFSRIIGNYSVFKLTGSDLRYKGLHATCDHI